MYKKGQYVVVAGSSLSADLVKKDYKFELAKIIEVAKYEMVVVPLSGYSYKKSYKIAKSSCCLIDTKKIKTHVLRPRPKPGDFVMAYENAYDKDKKKIGILMAIVDHPGVRTIGKILIDNMYEDVPFDDLMILEEKQL